MVKARSVVLLLVILSIFHSKHTFAAAGEQSVGLGIGQVLLLGDYSKNFSDGLGYNLLYDYEASNAFGILAHLSYSHHSNTDSSNRLSIIGFVPDLKVNLAYVDKLTFYMIGGFGVYRVIEVTGPVGGSAMTFGFNTGPGFDLRISPHFSFGTVISLHSIFGKTDPDSVTRANPAGISVGGTFMRLFLNAQYVF